MANRNQRRAAQAKHNSPEPTPEEINYLVTLFNQGNFIEAESFALKVTEHFPKFGFGWKVLGAVLKTLGRTEDSLGSMQKAAELMPGDAQAQSNLGVTLKELGRLEEAESSYRRALKIKPDYAEAHSTLGNILKDLGRLEEAEASYRRALDIMPDYADAHCNLAATLSDLIRLEEAEVCCRRALEINPHYAKAHYNLGNVHKDLGVTLKDLGRLKKAEDSYRRSLEIEPDFAEAHNNLGVVLKDMGRLEEAEACYRRALEIKPDVADTHTNLGVTLNDMDRLEEAETCFRRALVIKPDLADAHFNMGNTLSGLGRLEEAEVCYRCALEIKPDYAEALVNLGVILKDIGRFDESEVCCRRALEINPDFAEAHSVLLFNLNYIANNQRSDCFEDALKYGQMVANNVKTRFSAWHCINQPERLRVGLVSGDLRDHPVGYFLETVLSQIDSSRIELIAYPTDCTTSELTTRIKPYFSAWKSLVCQSDEVAASLIHKDGIHLLLDLSGHTTKNRLPMFAWKPAPVQVSWLGYFATTGVAEIDYLLADETGVPKILHGQFTEKIWYLPDTRLCFSPPSVCPDVSELPALNNGYITFGCFQNLGKVSDNVLKLWSSVLNALPGSRLRLQCKQLGNTPTSELFVQRLQNSGIDPARVSLFGAASRKKYLAAYAEVDMLLDTFPYTGGTTTCEALLMGVPTMTLTGNTMISRQGVSLLGAVGLSEWVALDEVDYVTKTVAVANDLRKLAAMRAGLRVQVLASPLFDAARFARNFEDALWGMWEKFKSESN